MTEVIIDPELKNWIIPLKSEEYSELEKSILEDGCRDPLVTWNGIIADGHHRFKICTDHNIPFKTIEKEFTNKDEVKLWMVRNQIARRNLEPLQRIMLVAKGESLIAERAKEKLELSQPKKGEQIGQASVILRSPKEHIKTSVEAAKLANVSERTYDKGKEILEKAEPEIVAKVIAGDISIHKAFTDIKKEEKETARKEELNKKIENVSKLPETITLHHADFLKEYNIIEKSSVDCIITDPPYVREWLENYSAFAQAAEYVLKPGGFLITYIGHIHMDRILAQMTPYLNYYWIMALKHTGYTASVPSRMVQCAMKPILIFQKPPRIMPKRYFSDLIEGSGREKDAHEWQQGEEELRQIFEPFTDPGDLVLDPFMGSGTTLLMAKKLNRRVIGIDINPENIDIVKARLSTDATIR